MKSIKDNKLHLKINQLISNFSSKTDLSPRGLISLLMFIYDLVNVVITDQFADEHFFQSLINLLKEEQLEALL